MLRFVVVACCLVVCAVGYPDGAPASACGSLNPSGHGTSLTQNQGGPTYNLIVTPSQGSYSVSLQALGSRTIMGFMIQAFDDSNNGIGSFTSLPSGVKTICGGTAVTQSQRLEAVNINVVWQGPAGASVTFRATAVESLKEYYTNITPVNIST